MIPGAGGRVVASSWIIVLVACSGDNATRSPAAVPAGTPVAVDTSPLLSVGTVSGDTLYELDRVVSPFLGPRGHLVVPLASAGTIRLFDADGRFVSSYGRTGRGPGEFEHIGGAWSRGDTIEVFDGSLRRFTRFHPDGQFDVIHLDDDVDVQSAAGPVPGGWIVHRVTFGSPASVAADASRRDSVIIHRFGLDGDYLGEVGGTLGMTRYRSPVISGPEPLSPRAILNVHDGRLYIGETLTPVVRVVEPDGTPYADIRWEAAPAGPLADVVSSVVDSAIARTPENSREATRARYADAPMPERISAWWDFTIDAEGFIWVKPFEPLRHAAALGGFGSGSYMAGGNAGGGTWLIVSPDRGIVTEIDLPLDFSPVQVLDDRVLGIRRDELGVESVQVLRLNRSN